MSYENHYEEFGVEPQPQQAQPRQVRVPFIRQPIGGGDVIARMTKAVGIKPCPPCERRRQWLNRLLRFVPR